MSKPLFLYHDTETTGVDEEDKIIETAYLAVGGASDILVYREELVNPQMPIKPLASVVHGYGNIHVKNKPLFVDIKSNKSLKRASLNKNVFYVAHNAPFDLGMLKKEGIEFPLDRVIDTLQIAKHMYQDEESHKLQYFRFAHEYDALPEFSEKMKLLGLQEIKPHTALSDVFILWIFLDKIREDFNLSVDKLVELSQTPAEEKNIKFGNVFKKETPYSEIVTLTYSQYGRTKQGAEYLDWAFNNMENMPLSRKFGIGMAIARWALKTKYKRFESYIRYGMIYGFNEKEIDEAVKLQNITYEEVYRDEVKNLEDVINSDLSLLDEDEYKKAMKNKQDAQFMLNYITKYRKNKTQTKGK